MWSVNRRRKWEKHLFGIFFIFSLQIFAYSGFVLKTNKEKIISNEEPTRGNEVGWSRIDLKFTSGLRRKRDLWGREYHVVQMKKESKFDYEDLFVNIHLTKKGKMIISPHLTTNLLTEGPDDESKEVEGNEYDYRDCFYDGISQLTGEEIRGTFYACGLQSGFNGILMHGKDQYIIKPDIGRQAERFEQEAEMELPHLILKINETLKAEDINKSEFNIAPIITHDDIHVPQDALEKAALFEESGEEDERKVGTLDVLEQKRAKLANPPTSSKNNKDNVRVVEIAIFTDEDFYKMMKKKFPKDTGRNLKDYVFAMVNTMDLLYEQQSLGVNISFQLVHLEMMKKHPEVLKRNGGSAKAYLTSFCDYAGDKNHGNSLWDHALLLTGLDLFEGDTRSTAGLAWAGTMCYRYYSCSISEGVSFGAAFIVTHEIGHSLGMEHDGTGINSLCDKEKYIMSPTTGPGKTLWSKCSSQNLKDFIAYGTSELRGRKTSSRPICLAHFGREHGIDFMDSKLPGQKYSSNAQCALSHGKSSKPVFKKDQTPFNNICWMLYCSNGTHAISTHPALEGTKCDHEKMCRGGNCVDNSLITLNSNKTITEILS